jgi:replicative superfamily II helicase
MFKDQDAIIKAVLGVEHRNTARKLKYIQGEPEIIHWELLKKVVGLLDFLTIRPTSITKKIAVLLSAIIWVHKNPNTDGLKDFLIKIFSRIGFSPSSIMVDDNFDSIEKKYSSISSYMDQVIATAHQIRHEIVLNQSIYLLTEFQHKVWASITSNNLIGISAPTSAGKSFIIALKTIELLQQKAGDVIYIVPTISLVSQVTVDYRKLLKEHGLDSVQIVNTYTQEDELGSKIYVLTQEKAIAAFSHELPPFQNVLLLVIDEIQNIERVGKDDDQRAKTLFDMITEFRNNCTPEKIIISGPRINEIGELGKSLTGLAAVEESTNESPVTNLTYSLKRAGKKIFLRLHTGIYKTLALQIENEDLIPVKIGMQYKENVLAHIFDLVENLGENASNIIFSPTTGQAEATAMYLAQRLGQVDSYHKTELNSLVAYISSTVHPKYLLNETLPGRVVFHHGKMPQHVRRVTERIINDKLVNNVVCTTTLMQGVNLPAQNIIVRNPYLCTRSKNGTKPALTDYELANLRGRAGRLLKDFLGRTFILEEEQFEESNEQTLFPEVTKSLDSGYSKSFKEHQEDVISDLRNGNRPSELNNKHTFLNTYIRQTALKSPDNLRERLSSVGIIIENSEIESVIKQMKDLTVPLSICQRNRYWDPLVLDDIYNSRQRFILPTSIQDKFTALKLENTIDLLREITPFYVNKYFGIENTEKFKLLTSACTSATKWLKETPLSEILSGDYYDNQEKVKRTIDSLQGEISYQLPMLLQPIYDSLYPESSFLRFLELGAYHPVTRKLIEHSVPRETAIFLNNKFFTEKRGEKINFQADLIPVLKQHFDSMDYWTRIQLEVLF